MAHILKESHYKYALYGFAFGAVLIFAQSAYAKDKEEDKAALVQCEQSYGTIAITDGSNQGWNDYKLASPRPLLETLVRESGCFTLLPPMSNEAADFLMSADAGSQEEIDQTMEMAKSAAAEAMVRSGAAGALLSKVPMGGAIMGMFGGLGGKKKTIYTALKLMNPRNGQILLAASGKSQKTMINLVQSSDWVGSASGTLGDYANDKNGRMVSAAFIESYNALIAQGAALSSLKQAIAAAENEAGANNGNGAMVAVDTEMRSAPDGSANSVRSLRAGTELTLTGERQGLYVECADKYGTKGWVSVEDLQ